MAELVANCPRCKAKSMTFDIGSQVFKGTQHNWQRWYEVFSVCRSCGKPTIFILAQHEIEASDALRNKKLADFDFALNNIFRVEGYVSLKDETSGNPPEYLPANIEAAFTEGAKCLAVKCPNAASSMFRLCLDLATKPLLPVEAGEGLNNSIRRNLGLRLPWLFKAGLLPSSLEELSSCIKDDGNDGAHDGSLSLEDAEDLQDFAFALLERLYTEPERIKKAKERREARRNKPDNNV